MKFAEPKNKNYCAVVVTLKNFVDLPNCNNVKAALIFGNSVIVGKDTQPGAVGLFFPVETALSPEFLAHNNLYRKPEWGNICPDAKAGFFEQHGRVKAMKFRGHKSEGFWIPLSSLVYIECAYMDFAVEGAEFDTIGDHEICRKYVSRRNPGRALVNKQGRKASIKDRIVRDQFRFHIETEQLRRNMHKITPETVISISDKWHGTSAIFSNVLIQRELSWYERLAKKLGIKIQEAEYGYVWASRRVIKGLDGEAKKDAAHFYDEDIWGIVGREVQEKVPPGYTIYGEIVGYTPTAQAIQPGYHYGCAPGTHRFVVYRITVTSASGQVLELSWPQMKEFCAKYGLEMVKEMFFGTAKMFLAPGKRLTELPAKETWHQETDEEWQERFLNNLVTVIEDRLCQYNNLEVPAEGIVVRIEHLDVAEAYKLKSFMFLKRESDALDKGEADLEAEQEIAVKEQ